MMNNIILNGVNSNTIQGLIIQELPPISKPAIRTEIEEIDGRDGDLITKLGYAAYDKQLSIGLYGNYDINQVISFFNTSGTVIFSNEPDKYYNYEILDQIDFERLVRFRTANVTMHVQPFKYSTTEIEQELSGTIITAEGTNLNLVNTEDGGSFTDLEIKGDTSQQTYSGKNLCGIPDQTFTHNGVTVTIQDGEITLNGTATASGTKNLTPIKTTTLQAQQYTLSKNYISGSMQNDTGQSNFNVRNSSSGSFIFNVTLQESKKSYTFSSATSIIFGIYVYSGVVYNNYKFKPQLELGSTVTEYEPYVGGIPSPNPDYPQEVKTVTGDNNIVICGKNLFNGYEVGYINSSNGSDETNNNAHRSFYIPVKPNTTYTTSTLVTRLCEYDKNKRFIQCLFNTSNSFTTQSNTYYLRLGFGNTVTTNQLDTEMFEQGSTATDYEAYQSQTYPISLGNIELCLINGTEDYIYKNNGTWYQHSVIGKVVLNGSETIYKGGTTLNQYFNAAVITNYIKPVNNDQNVPHFSSHFINKSPNQLSGGSVIGSAIRRDNSIGFAFGVNSEINTVAKCKTWLSNNTPEFYYLLETATDTEITDSTLLSQLNTLENATTYAGETNVIVSGSVLTPTLYVETLTIDDPVLRITNSGNTIAKPIITLCGTGIINLSLNGEQIFVVNLSNDSYVTIDVANMEAYYNGVLKNRLVTGNYENFVLNQGENEITFTGTLYSMKISNYSRWI